MLKGLFKRVGAVLRGSSVIDGEMLEELEEALIQADVSVTLAMKLVSDVREQAERKKITDPLELTGLLRKKIEQLLRPLEAPLNTGPTAPTTMLVIGVNGVGKTTSIAKIAHWYKSAGNNVMIVAGDTFRAAAIEQLKVWAGRIGCDIVAQHQGADPAAAVYDALQAAGPRKTNLMVIDTAGRLHTKHNLMEELRKIYRVITRELGRPADEKLLVLDGTTGQNALNQVKQFHEAIGVTGLVLTKMDSTAKGGIVLTIADQVGIPIKLIGTGEKVTDLKLFSAQEFAEELF